MQKILLIVLLAMCAGAHANPQGKADEMGHFMADRGILSRISAVGEEVEARATELVVNSMAFLGVPYKLGGTNAEYGFDCSGFVRAMFEQTAGLILPRRAEQQAAVTKKIDKTELKPGDLVFFNTLRRTFSHVGIYVGNGKFIHSPKPGAEVRVEDMGMSYWAKRFDGARRVNAEDTQQASSR
ncbi:MAG: C40 family peptidase [Rhodoferax sp.]|jgi:cell wall-associated NlpC family hydrolase